MRFSATLVRKKSRYSSGTKREFLEENRRRAGAAPATTPELIQKVEKIVLDNTRLKKKQLAEMIEVSDKSILKIMHDHLGITKVNPRWVPNVLVSAKIRAALGWIRLA